MGQSMLSDGNTHIFKYYSLTKYLKNTSHEEYNVLDDAILDDTFQ